MNICYISSNKKLIDKKSKVSRSSPLASSPHHFPILANLLDLSVLLPAPVVQVLEKDLPPHREPSRLIEPRHCLPGIDATLLDQISADQIAGPVQAVGAVHGDQTLHINNLF